MKRSGTVILGLTMVLFGSIAAQSARSQEINQEYIEKLRAAAKMPPGSRDVYNVCIQPEFRETLQAAAHSCNDALVSEMLQIYSGSQTAIKGKTALMWASWFGDNETVKALLDCGASAKAQDVNGDTPLHHAMGLGNSGVVRMLLDKGADVNAKNSEGVTPLMLAAADKPMDNLKAMLEKGGKVNLQNSKGETALMLAAHNGRKGNVLLLLEKGADFQLKTKKGETALDYAKTGMAPWQGFHDSPGYLGPDQAKQLEAEAKKAQAEIIELLKIGKDWKKTLQNQTQRSEGELPQQPERP